MIRIRKLQRICFPPVVLGFLLLSGCEAARTGYDLILTGGHVIDGSGNPWFKADVGIRDGRIVAVGSLDGVDADQVLDVDGRIVAPGFIDLHSHAGEGRRSLGSEDARDRAAPNLIAQGATTLVVNQDGRSPWPISEQRATFESIGIGPNAILLVGHGRVRSEVMGDDFRRLPTAGELEQMRGLVRQAMEDGAYGMSGGHEYSPMIWSDTDEVAALVAEVAPWDGIYVIHERSSGPEPMWWWPSQDEPGAPTMEDSVRETIEVAQRTGVNSVQTHIKARGSHYWGTGQTLVDMIQAARDRGVTIWADAYSYNTTGTDGNTVLIPPFVRDIARDEAEAADIEEADYAGVLERLLASADSALMIRTDVRHEIRRRGGAANLLVLENADASYVGQTLGELADARGLDPVEMAIQLQLEGDATRAGGGRLRGFSLSEDDLAVFYAQPWVATASDAGITMVGDGTVHPRFYGTFPRRIRRFAMEKGIGTVENAVRTMTSLPAQILGLRDRGLVREGMRADLVVFDLDGIRDMATALEPHQYAEGIDYVVVNGQMVLDGGELTGALPGMVITPETARARPVVN